MCDSKFDSLPWLSLKTDKQNCYLAKYAIDDISVKLIVCDTCYVYEEVLSAEEAVQRFTSLNNDIEIPKNVLIEELQNIFRNLTNNRLVCNISSKDTSLVMKISMKIFGDIEVSWQSHLKRSAPEVFQKQFVVPLLALNHNLNLAVSELTQTAINKDRQINDYKNQRFKLLVKHYETADFNEDEFVNKRCSNEYLAASFDASTSKLSESCVKLSEDACFRKICQNIYCKAENPGENSQSLNTQAIDETQVELKKRKELEEKINNQKPSTMPRKKKLNL